MIKSLKYDYDFPVCKEELEEILIEARKGSAFCNNFLGCCYTLEGFEVMKRKCVKDCVNLHCFYIR